MGYDEYKWIKSFLTEHIKSTEDILTDTGYFLEYEGFDKSSPNWYKHYLRNEIEISKDILSAEKDTAIHQ